MDIVTQNDMGALLEIKMREFILQNSIYLKVEMLI